ncbi:MAG TPA: FkbM family methyltransferase [Polyangiaceae bacterium]|nr:FkbM family methyltransferase [Polyangiaceae bacterium]
MKQTGLKEFIFSTVKRCGYELRRVGSFHSDAFYDQSALLRGREVKVVIDGGALDGGTALQYAALFPRAAVYSFEPFPESFANVQRAVAHEPRIKAVNLALAERVGERTFHSNRDGATNSLLPNAPGIAKHLPADWVAPMGATTVQCTTADAFAAERNIDKIDLLKLDVQGGELLVLAGAENLIKRHAIDVIYTEVNYAETYAGAARYYDLFSHLEARGYRLYGLYNLSYYRRNSIVGGGDAIFISPELEASLAQRTDL